MKGKYLVVAFFLSQVMDILSTYYGINSFYLSEVNPIARTLFGKIGMTDVMILKLLLSYAVLTFYVFSLRKYELVARALERSLQIASIGTWSIVGLNFFGMYSSNFLH